MGKPKAGPNESNFAHGRGQKPDRSIVICTTIDRARLRGLEPGFDTTCNACQTPIHVLDETLEHVAGLPHLKSEFDFVCIPCGVKRLKGSEGGPKFIPPSARQIATLRRHWRGR
jgi:hypothetical protein